MLTALLCFSLGVLLAMPVLDYRKSGHNTLHGWLFGTVTTPARTPSP